MSEAMKLVANNKKAYHDYFIEEKYEAGIVLHAVLRSPSSVSRMERFSHMECM